MNQSTENSSSQQNPKSQQTTARQPLKDCLCVFAGAIEAVQSLCVVQNLFYYGSHDGNIRSFDTEVCDELMNVYCRLEKEFKF